MTKKVLITGAAGFIGSHLIEKLLQKGWKVIGVDDFNDFYNPKIKQGNLKDVIKNSSFVLEKGDIVDREFVKRVVDKYKPEYIVHLAARAGVRPSIQDPKLYTRVNIIGTLNILEAVKDKKIENFIFGSSSSVYGDNRKKPFSEEDRVENQISPYAITKRSGELLCKVYSGLYDIPITALRFFTVYGPRQRPDLAIYKFMKNILEGRSIEMFGTGSTSRDYTYVDDIVDGVIKALNKKQKFEIINLGNSHPVKLSQLIKEIEKAVGKKAKVKKISMQPGDVEHTYADIRKAKKLLNWAPKTNFQEGLEKMAKWMREN